MVFKTNNIQRAVIKSDGTIGIGTTGPTKALQVRAGTDAAADVYTQLCFNKTATYETELRFNEPDNGPRILANASTETLSIQQRYGNSPSVNISIGDTAGWSMDSQRRITTPYQPCFQATTPTNSAIASGLTILTYSTENFDVGGNYNTGTYRFTAPVTGKYLFNLSVNLYNNPGVWAAVIRLNGSTSYYGNRMTSNITGDNNVVATAILSLTANDYVEPYVQSTNGGSMSNSASWNRFEGFLIG